MWLVMWMSSFFFFFSFSEFYMVLSYSGVMHDVKMKDICRLETPPLPFCVIMEGWSSKIELLAKYLVSCAI